MCANISQEPLDRSSNVLCKPPVAVDRSSSDGAAISYVLLVLWMTSGLAVMGPMAYFNTLAEFEVYECLVNRNFLLEQVEDPTGTRQPRFTWKNNC